MGARIIGDVEHRRSKSKLASKRKKTGPTLKALERRIEQLEQQISELLAPLKPE